VIERALILSPAEARELEVAEPLLPAAPPPAAARATAAAPDAGELRLGAVERDHILATLRATGWRVEGADGAAARLGLKPSTLRSRMKKLGVRRPGAA